MAAAKSSNSEVVALRTAQNLTQEKLAWEAGLSSKGYLSRIESGERLPSLETLDRLAQRLTVEVRDLLIFPQLGVVDQVMELVRLRGPSFAARVLAMPEAARPSGTKRPKARSSGPRPRSSRS